MPSPNLADRLNVDPYLQWAWDTRRKGIQRPPGGQSSTELFRVIAERRGGAPAPSGVGVAPVYLDQAIFTAVLPYDDLPSTFLSLQWRSQRGVIGVELGMPLRSGVSLPPLGVELGEPDGVDDENVIAVIDYGCPFAHPLYRDGDGTRVRFLWDQGREPNGDFWNRVVPRPMTTGQVQAPVFDYGAEALPHANRTAWSRFDEAAAYEAVDYRLMRERASHGAHVLSVAAGWPNPLDAAAAKDVAAGAGIVFVQLPEPAVLDTSGGSMAVYVLDALHYIAMRTRRAKRVVVNLSYGTLAGSHDGGSLLERAMDSLIEQRRNAGQDFHIVIPAGNGFNSGCHARLSVAPGRSVDVPWQVMSDDPTDSFLELWYPAGRAVEVDVVDPAGRPVVNRLRRGEHKFFPKTATPDQMQASVHHAVGSTRGVQGARNCVLVSVAPTHSPDGSRAEAAHGIWRITVHHQDSNDPSPIQVLAHVERDDPVLDDTWRGRQSRLLIDPQDDDRLDYPAANTGFQPTKAGTLNSYAHGRLTNVVGAARATAVQGPAWDLQWLAPYTAAGAAGQRPAPDFVAAADESAVLGGRLAGGNLSGAQVRMDGTSVAAPQLARALLNSDLTINPLPAPGNALAKARWGAGLLR